MTNDSVLVITGYDHNALAPPPTRDTEAVLDRDSGDALASGAGYGEVAPLTG